MSIAIIVGIFWLVGYWFVLFLSGGVAKKAVAKLLQVCLGLIIGLIIMGIFVGTAYQEEKRWNNGTCSNCGGDYIFTNASQYKATTYYFYQCEDCHQIFKTTQRFTPKK